MIARVACRLMKQPLKVISCRFGDALAGGGGDGGGVVAVGCELWPLVCSLAAPVPLLTRLANLPPAHKRSFIIDTSNPTYVQH